MEHDLKTGRIWPADDQLLIDCDPGMGVRGADVDDNLAVLTALAAARRGALPPVRGVCVTFGNTPLKTGLRSLDATLALVPDAPPVYAGAAGAGQTGQTAASAALVEGVQAAPGRVHLLALGPLTNVAAAMQADPDFAGNLASLTLMAGAFRFPWFGQIGDPNIRWDRHSAATVLRAHCAKTLITMDACVPARFTPEHQARLAAIDTPLARHMTGGIDNWLRRHRRFGLPGFFPWDVVALGWLIDPSLFDRVDTHPVRLTERGLRPGKILRVPKRQPHRAYGPAVARPRQLDGRRFMNMMLTLLCEIAAPESPAVAG